jgi:3-oxoadipate enol-lactonase
MGGGDQHHRALSSARRARLPRLDNDEFATSNSETLIAFSQLCASYDMAPYLPRINAPVLGIYPRSRPEQIALLRQHLRKLDWIELATEYLMIYNVYPRICADAVLHFAALHDGVPCVE